MPEPVGLDTAALASLADQVAQCAAELSALSLTSPRGLAGSAVAATDGIRRVAADVHRHASAVGLWVTAARQYIDEITATEQAHTHGLRMQ